MSVTDDYKYFTIEVQNYHMGTAGDPLTSSNLESLISNALARAGCTADAVNINEVESISVSDAGEATTSDTTADTPASEASNVTTGSSPAADTSAETDTTTDTTPADTSDTTPPDAAT